MPNGEHTFELPVSSVGRSSGDDPGAWQPLERIEVTSLMWQDGVVEGDRETARQHDALERQRSAHIRALLKILRGSRRSIAALRDEIAGTRPPDVEMEQVRNGLIEQLDEFATRGLSSNVQEFGDWLGRVVIEQEQWLGRIVFPKL
jgi:hypothetical protein